MTVDAQRPWTAHYPPGVSADLDITRYGSLIDLFEESFARYADKPAYVCMGKTLTYGEWDRLSSALAAWLQSKGLKQGDRVAIMLPNLLQYPVAVAAVLRAGMIAVNINPLYTPRELAHQLKDSGATAIIVLENFATTLEQVLATPGSTAIRHIVVAAVGDMLGLAKGMLTNYVVRRVKKAVPVWSLPGATRFPIALALGKKMRMSPVTVNADDVAVLQYTGGTTGVAKGATLLHRTIIATLLASEAWTMPGLQRRQIEGQITLVCALPLYHVFAFITCALLGMRLGGLNILIPNPRDMEAFIGALAKHRFHVFPGVNTLFAGMAAQPAFAQLDFSQLVISTGGGTAVQEAVANKWLAITGCPIAEGYGLSETCSGVTSNRTDTDAFTGTIGLPLPNVELKILDDDEQEVPTGERGEIAIRGPQVMRGYWQKDEETAKVMTKDGFFKTGDIGIMDARGYTKIVDRKKDMILVSGFNVYPNEVEGVVASMAGVRECAVIGVPDKNSGEAVMLFIVKGDDALDETQVSIYCAANLTGYKKPRHIRFVDDLPKTNVGKILRRELRDEVMKTLKA